MHVHRRWTIAALLVSFPSVISLSSLYVLPVPAPLRTISTTSQSTSFFSTVNLIDKPLRPEECLLRCLLCSAASASTLSYDIKRVPNVRAFPFTATNGDSLTQDIDILATTDGSGQFDREVIKKSIIDSDSR